MRHRDDVVYCAVTRNGSGQDAGQIDYAINHTALSKLPAADVELLLLRLQQMTDEIDEYFDAGE